MIFLEVLDWISNNSIVALTILLFICCTFYATVTECTKHIFGPKIVENTINTFAPPMKKQTDE